MKTITLTDQEGSKLTGQLPEGWHEVLLSDFLNYHTQLEGKPEGMAALIACATLTSLPTDALTADVSLVPLILPHMPFFAQLPKPEALAAFTHNGITYEHVGNLDKVDAAQFEALLDFLQAAEGNPVQAAPNLLAVLYKMKGKPQTSEAVTAVAEAFRSLPMSLAWGAVAFFLTSSQPYAERIHSLSLSRSEAMKAVSTLERLVATPSPTRLSRTAGWLVSRYTRSARAMLAKS